MADIEKIIKGLEDIQKHLDTGYSYAISWKSELIRDTLTLLKEQDNAYRYLLNQFVEVQNQLNAKPEIVRCKDCKWLSEKGFCKHPNGGAGNIRSENWYCADGERKDDG